MLTSKLVRLWQHITPRTDIDSSSAMQQSSDPPLSAFSLAQSWPATSSSAPLVSRFRVRKRSGDGIIQKKTSITRRVEPVDIPAADDTPSCPRSIVDRDESNPPLLSSSPATAIEASTVSEWPACEHWLYLRDWEAISRLIRRVGWVCSGVFATRQRECLLDMQCLMDRVSAFPKKRYAFVRMLGDILFNQIEGPRGLGTTTKTEFEDAVVECLVELRITIDVSDLEFFPRLRRLEDVYARWAVEDALNEAFVSQQELDEPSFDHRIDRLIKDDVLEDLMQHGVVEEHPLGCGQL